MASGDERTSCRGSAMQSRMYGVAISTSAASARPRAVGARQQALRDRGLEHARELVADLILLVRRERRDDAVDGFRRVERVQRREHEVAGLGGDERRLDRLGVAHFADEDDVGVLAQRAAQARRVRRRVEADFALRDDRLRVLVHELDRVFDREDVQRRACG